MQRPVAYLTTSWDDGHPLDLRLAELLHKYSIPATFYVPRRHVLPVLDAPGVRQLSELFEIGGHTLNHVDLLRVDDATARAEIAGCREALRDITGTECRCFCFPGGHFRRRHLAFVRQAGFSAARTVELMSLAPPLQRDGVALLPTTVLAHPLSFLAVARNLVKRAAFANAMTFLMKRQPSWTAMAVALLDHVAHSGGVFHLWGHSWEIEDSQEWTELEKVFSAISERRQFFHMATNGGLSELVTQMQPRRFNDARIGGTMF